MRRKTLALGLVVLAFGGVATSAVAETAAEKRLRLLEEQLEKTQEEVQNLRRELREQKTMGEKRAQDSRDAMATAQKSFELPEWVKKFTLFGDVRIRHEGFYHRPHEIGDDAVHARNRERYRARIGLKYTFSDELSGTVRLASGNPDDPISTNDTFSGDFTRKRVSIDWAYITLAPGATFGLRPGVLTIHAGKQPNPIFKVGELVFDEDVSPEGFSETVALLGAPMGPLDQVKLHAFQWTFREVDSAQDGWLFGGQINPQMHFGTTLVEAGVGQYWYLNDDLIASASNSNSQLEVGGATGNAVFEEDDEVAGYRSAFNLTNGALAVTFPNVIGAQPFRVFGDVVYNHDAFDGDDDWGYQGGVKLGQTKTRGDWAVTALYEWVEQEAVLSAFSWSDFGLGGTNQMGPVVALDYQLLNPLTITARGYFTNFIDRPAGMTNPTQTRLQLDAQLRF
jgi:hypothetical protein